MIVNNRLLLSTWRQRRRQSLRKREGTQEAHLVALACSDPPLGQKRRALRLRRDT